MRSLTLIPVVVALVAGALLVSPKLTRANAPSVETPRAVAAPPQFGRTTLERPAARRAARVVIGFGPDATRREKQRAVARVGGSVDRSISTLDATVVDVPDSQVAQAVGELEHATSVQYAEADLPVSAVSVTAPNDMLWPSQWGLKLIGMPAAWLTLSGSAPVIAVLDTGADFAHPDLNGAFVPGYDVVNGDADPTDDNGHGTAAAGVIAARADNAEGGAGVCPICTVMPVKVLNATGGGTDSTVAAGVVWAVEHGARVISMSLGGPGISQVLSDAVAYAITKGVVLIGAAGNSGTTTQFFPAANPGVLSVAGTNSADVLYDWSNRGAWVNVAAPGCNVAPARGGSYENFCGTSSATPVVAGLAGLVLALRPQASILEVNGALMSGIAVSNVQHGRVDVSGILATLGLKAPPPPAAPPAASPASPASPAAPLTSVVGTWSGRLGRGVTTVSRSLAGGPVRATVTAPTGTSLAVSLVSQSGRTVASARGRAPLSLRRTVTKGRYRFVIRGARGAAVSLRIVHTATSGGTG
jgi:subtilisin family serine protease